MVKEELIKIKHTSVETEILKPKDCPFKPKFEEKNVNVSACRLDCVLAEVFHLSRRDSQVLIASESIFINGMSMMNNAYNLKDDNIAGQRTKYKV
jgi:RNA-binding protein YlmH